MISQTQIDELKQIGTSVNSGTFEIEAFERFISTIATDADQHFTERTWTQNWRSAAYEFGHLFEKNDAGPCIHSMQTYVDSEESSELVCFLYSEVIWNFFEQNNSYVKDLFKGFIKKFPHNPEFHNSYGLYLQKNTAYEQAILEHKFAIRLDNKSENFMNCYYSAVKRNFDYLISKNKLEDAKTTIDDFELFLKENGVFSKPFWGNELRSRISNFRDRLKDHEIIVERVNYFKADIENSIRTEQRRLIEVLGIFAAVLAFIFANISIGLLNLSIQGVLVLMLGMALVLLIFAISISYLFGPRFRYASFFFFLRRPKFWSLILLLILLIMLICCSPVLITQSGRDNSGPVVENKR